MNLWQKDAKFAEKVLSMGTMLVMLIIKPVGDGIPIYKECMLFRIKPENGFMFVHDASAPIKSKKSHE